jgi:hypothetical protein
MKRPTSLFAFAFAFALGFPPAAAVAQQVGPYTPAPTAATEGAAREAAAAAAAAPRLAERWGLQPLAELGDAASEARDRLDALRAWNGARRLPVHNGFARPLAAPRRVELTAALLANPVTEHAGGLAVLTAFDRLAWGAKVRVAGAWRLRLHLSGVSLPAGARLWLHGAGETAGPFGTELVDSDGGLWTPSVGGEEAALDVEVPAAALAGAGRLGFALDRVMELFEPATAGVTQKDSSCDVDASCISSSDFPAFNTARHAVAMIVFNDGPGESGQCTAQLLGDSASSGTPYLLTANHCVSSSGSASSLEAFWDYYTPSCNAPAPGLAGLPRSNGSTLLTTGSAPGSSDYTLMRLNSIPSGRSFLGWNADPNAAGAGTLFYRLSHPNGEPQTFNETRSDPAPPACSGVPRPRFLYSDLVRGATHAGSSGSAAILANGQVVAQLYGGCGNDNDCSPLQFTVDGAFSQSFAALQPFLQPGSTRGSCRRDNFTLCLLSSRFRVQVGWTNQFDGSSGSGRAIASTDSTGFFYFTDPSNYELVVKILNFGNVIKVFYGELTDLQFTITVIDTVSGAVKTYKNTPGDCGAIDNNAFSTGGASAAAKLGGAGSFAGGKGALLKRGSCVPGHGTLCLLDRRFTVTTAWMNQFDGSSGTGSARSLSDQSGLFTFTDPSVIELVMKAVEFPDRVAFFYSALSNYQYDIQVTDTVGGTTKTYHNAAGTYCGGLDNNAFPP